MVNARPPAALAPRWALGPIVSRGTTGCSTPSRQDGRTGRRAGGERNDIGRAARRADMPNASVAFAPAQHLLKTGGEDAAPAPPSLGDSSAGSLLALVNMIAAHMCRAAPVRHGPAVARPACDRSKSASPQTQRGQRGPPTNSGTTRHHGLQHGDSDGSAKATSCCLRGVRAIAHVRTDRIPQT